MRPTVNFSKKAKPNEIDSRAAEVESLKIPDDTHDFPDILDRKTNNFFANKEGYIAQIAQKPNGSTIIQIFNPDGDLIERRTKGKWSQPGLFAVTFPGTVHNSPYTRLNRKPSFIHTTELRGYEEFPSPAPVIKPE